MKIEKTIERLEILRNYMKTVAPHTFDFCHWWERGDKTESWTCGFTACALGHACYVPQFKKLGLRLGRSEGYYRNVVLIRKKRRVAEDLEAAQRFFGIDYELALRLFTPDDPKSPKRTVTSEEWAEYATNIINDLKQRHGIKLRPRSSAKKLIPVEVPLVPGVVLPDTWPSKKETPVIHPAST